MTQFELRENVVASFVYAFEVSSPEMREKLWQQLEKDKADAETLRYKAVVETLDLPLETVEDLVEMFAANEAEFRNVLWDRVAENTAPV